MSIRLDFVVVGPPRTGTTWLHQSLIQHPDICLPKEKQTHYFDKHYHLGPNWFSKKFANGNQCVEKYGEITPDYISNEEALRRISKYNKNVKVIMIYRDPIARAYSHYLIRRDSGKQAGDFKSVFKDDPYLEKNSLYGKNLKFLLDIFPPKNVLIVDFDDIKLKPKKVLEEICQFVGVRPLQFKVKMFGALRWSAKINIFKVIFRRRIFSSFRLARRLTVNEWEFAQTRIIDDQRIFHDLVVKHKIKKVSC